MPGGIEQSPQLKTYFGIQARKGRANFKTMSVYSESQGAQALSDTAALETKLPKHEVRLVPVDRAGSQTGEPIPHKLTLPKLNAAAKKPAAKPAAKAAAPAKQKPETYLDLKGGSAKKVGY